MEPSDEVLRTFLISHKLLANYFERAFAAGGAPALYEAALLKVLMEKPDRSIGMEAGRRALGVTKSGISRIVDRMVKAGWVDRREDEKDRRITNIYLAEGGKGALARLDSAYSSAFAPGFLKVLNESELLQLVRLLKKLSAGLLDEDASCK